jgi:hypothetical protein
LLWPFTSRAKSFDTLTLPINAVVRGNASRVIGHLRAERDEPWRRTAHEWQGIGDESDSGMLDRPTTTWLDTTGATRYTYIADPETGGEWVRETAQLHEGTYFGARHHLRLYEGGTGEHQWTAVQAHHEHWDPFRLRHTVGSLTLAQHHFERQYYGKAYVRDISRERFANGGIADTDGWVTVVDLREAPLAALGVVLFGSVLGSSATASSLRDLRSWLSTTAGQRGVALAGVLLSLPLFVREVSIALEGAFPGVPVKAIAGLGYLMLAFGIPLAALSLPTGGDALDWFGVGVVTLGAGFLLDYQRIGIEMLPIGVVLHRLAAVLTVGVLAAAATQRSADRWDRPTLVGLALWVAVLAWPLVSSL